MLFGVQVCYVHLVYIRYVFIPCSNDVYWVPDAFTQRFGAMTAWEHWLSSIACCNATLKIHSLSRMVEVRGVSISDLQWSMGSVLSVLCQANPKINNSCSERRVEPIIESGKDSVCISHLRGFRTTRFPEIQVRRLESQQQQQWISIFSLCLAL